MFLQCSSPPPRSTEQLRERSCVARVTLSYLPIAELFGVYPLRKLRVKYLFIFCYDFTEESSGQVVFSLSVGHLAPCFAVSLKCNSSVLICVFPVWFCLFGSIIESRGRKLKVSFPQVSCSCAGRRLENEQILNSRTSCSEQD